MDRPSSLLRPLVSLALAGVTFAPAVALACGGGITIENATIEIAQHVAFYSVREAGPTDVVVQLAVPQGSEPFGVILPVRGTPDLDPDPVETSELRNLDISTTPQLVYEDDAGGGSSDSGCGCGESALDGGGAGGGSGRGNGVDVLDGADIGPVTAVSFAATDAEALDTWLDENGFVVPDAARTTLEAYVDEGTTFIAFKRRSDASDLATSVGVHFTVPEAYDDYPLRMAAVGAASQLGIRVFLASEEGGRGPTAPFTSLTLDDLSTDLVRDEGYTAAVATAVRGAGGRAFLVEGIFEPSSRWRDGLGPRLSAMTGAQSTLTRLTTVIDRTALTEDVTFDTPVETAPREIYLTAAARLGRPRPGPVKWGSVGVFALGTATVLIRRRRRSRG